MLAKEGNKEAIELADYFCRESRVRIEQSFRDLYGANDDAMRTVAKHVLAGQHTWIERGIVGLLGGPLGASGGTTPQEPGNRSVRREAAGV